MGPGDTRWGRKILGPGDRGGAAMGLEEYNTGRPLWGRDGVRMGPKESKNGRRWDRKMQGNNKANNQKKKPRKALRVSGQKSWVGPAFSQWTRRFNPRILCHIAVSRCIFRMNSHVRSTFSPAFATCPRAFLHVRLSWPPVPNLATCLSLGDTWPKIT